MSDNIPKNLVETATTWKTKQIKFISFYRGTKVLNEHGFWVVEHLPISCYFLDKFAECYDGGDFNHLSRNQVINKAKNYARDNLGLAFEGDCNPVTGNQLRGWSRENPQVTGIIYIEDFPFANASAKLQTPV